MNEQMQIIREVNNQAELFYTDSVSLGNHAAIALGDAHRAQLTSLENIAESAFKTSDIFDYLKKQTARSKESQDWRRPENRNATIGFGDRLRAYLEQTLHEKAGVINARLPPAAPPDEDAQRRRRIHLLLIRQFLRQMVVQYEYQVSFGMRQRER